MPACQDGEDVVWYLREQLIHGLENGEKRKDGQKGQSKVSKQIIIKMSNSNGETLL